MPSDTPVPTAALSSRAARQPARGLLSRWRVMVVVTLMAAPLLFLLGFGAWSLWQQPNVAFIAWWPMMLCFATAYLLAWWWQRRARLLSHPDEVPPLYWTERDHEAWKLVEARAKNVKDVDPEKFTTVNYYVDVAMEMAQELARFYHPKTQDPVGALTIPEILAVVELASHDLGELVDKYLPAGHLLTVDHWRSAPKVRDWYDWGAMAYWAVSALFNPVQTVARYAAAQVGVSQPFRLLQENLVAWFFAAYVHRVGTYLIEVNSGRLRVGASRYRALLDRATRAQQPAPGMAPPVDLSKDEAASAPDTVTITLLGQVKAGKSSLINALLGERQAATDVLPLTAEITRYQLAAPGVSDQLVVLDSVGYLHEGPRADQLEATMKEVQNSDVVLLVLNARDPARQPDVELMGKLRDWFAARPHLRCPPLIGVLTHIDLLSPVMEWAPPYDWQSPQRPKEESIAAAVAATREVLGQFLVGLVPVCTAEGKVLGVKEWLLPFMIQHLSEGRAVAFLRCLHAEASAKKIRKVLSQLRHAGMELWRVAIKGDA